MIIPSVTLRKRKIVENEEIEKYESGPLWVVDEDYKRGKELNFKIYDDLSGLHEVYLDGETSNVEDIADSITAGATMVTISESMQKEKMKRALFLTDSLILYVKEAAVQADFFVMNGGKYFFSDSRMIENAAIQFTNKLSCDRCNLIVPVGDYNGGRNKEATALP